MQLPDIANPQSDRREMSIPENPNQIIQAVRKIQDELIYPFEYGSYEFWEGTLDDFKKFEKMLKSAVVLVRSSPEYRKYIKYLREEFDMAECSLLRGITTDNASIEVHHYPFTLFDITEIVALYMKANHIDFTIFDLAERVCKLHYQNKVGLVALSSTVHELAHSGAVFIPLKNVFGDVRSFCYEYNSGMNGDHLEKIKSLVDLEDSAIADTNNKAVLARKRLAWVLGPGSCASTMLLEDNSNQPVEEPSQDEQVSQNNTAIDEFLNVLNEVDTENF